MKCKICLIYFYYIIIYILCYILSFISIVAGDRFVVVFILSTLMETRIQVYCCDLFCSWTLNIMYGKWESIYVSPPEKNTDWPKWTVLKYDGSVFALFFCLCFSQSDIAMYLRIKEKLITFLSWIRFYTARPNQQTTLQSWAGLIQIQPMTL